MLSSEFHVELFVRKEDGENYLILQKNAEDMIQVSFREKVGALHGKKLHMKIQSDKEKYSFYFGVEEESLQLIGTGSTRFLCCELAGKCFTGTVWGLYTVRKQETTAELLIDSWEMLQKQMI